MNNKYLAIALLCCALNSLSLIVANTKIRELEKRTYVCVEGKAYPNYPNEESK